MPALEDALARMSNWSRTMQRTDQIALLQRLLGYVDTKTTALADDVWENDTRTYTDPAHLEREQAELFRKHPLFMGFARDWPEPGSYSTDDHAGVPILISRGRDGVLRAFLNVCRHRGSKVVDGCGKARVFSCPYHAWTYDLSGKVMGIPDERAFPNVRQDRESLKQLPLCEKHGLVWVHATPAGDGAGTFDIDPWLGGLGPELGSWGFDTWSFYDRRLIPEPMNWKIMVDTFNEGYHIGFLHKESLGPILHGNVTDFQAFGPNHRLVFPRKKLERLKGMPQDEWDAMWYSTIVYSLFPNTIFIVQGDHVEVNRMFPSEGRADRAVMDLGLYVPKAPTTDEERTHWDKNMRLILDVVTGEDFPAGRTMQLGFHSGAQTHTVYGRNEPAMIHYHQSLRRALQLPVTHRTQAAAE
jgi:phenylpropionate dioxygenase-like ring-hydroxylating dioxygenase large terminal subunit